MRRIAVSSRTANPAVQNSSRTLRRVKKRRWVGTVQLSLFGVTPSALEQISDYFPVPDVRKAGHDRAAWREATSELRQHHPGIDQVLENICRDYAVKALRRDLD